MRLGPQLLRLHVQMEHILCNLGVRQLSHLVLVAAAIRQPACGRMVQHTLARAPERACRLSALHTAVRCKWSWIIIPPARPAAACSLERATVEGCQCPSPFRYGGSAATRRACHAVSSAGCHHRRRCRPCDICGACSHLHQPSPSTFAANRHHRSPSAPAPPSQPLPDPPRDPASTGT